MKQKTESESVQHNINYGTIYLYVDTRLLVVYCDYVDNQINKKNKQLTRCLVSEGNLKCYVKYYQLRLHPLALKNITHE